MSLESETVDGPSLTPDAVLDLAFTPEAEGSSCAVLTPAIRAKLREMAAGQMLEVRVSDPTAREDLASWCRMTGNALIAAREEPPGILRAWLRKKQG